MGGGGGGWGGHLGTEGGSTRVTYFSEEGVFFKTYFFCTQVQSMGGGGGGVKIPLQSTKYPPSDSRSDWANVSVLIKEGVSFKKNKGECLA